MGLFVHQSIVLTVRYEWMRSQDIERITARSRVKLTIEDVLDQGLPRAYTPDIYKQECSAVFEHVYEAYGDRGTSQYVQSHGV